VVGIGNFPMGTTKPDIDSPLGAELEGLRLETS
jgi:hypothetical protein